MCIHTLSVCIYIDEAVTRAGSERSWEFHLVREGGKFLLNLAAKRLPRQYLYFCTSKSTEFSRLILAFKA